VPNLIVLKTALPEGGVVFLLMLNFLILTKAYFSVILQAVKDL